jgi:hypothetical protein
MVHPSPVGSLGVPDLLRSFRSVGLQKLRFEFFVEEPIGRPRLMSMGSRALPEALGTLGTVGFGETKTCDRFLRYRDRGSRL